MDKSADAFRTISEVAEDLDLPQHVLRFWETRFTQIKPLKRGGGRRYYRPADVDLIKGIKYLLYDRGFTIKGVQRLLKTHGIQYGVAVGLGDFDLANEIMAARENAETEAAEREISVPIITKQEPKDPELEPEQDMMLGAAKLPKTRRFFLRPPDEERDGPIAEDKGSISKDNRALLQEALFDLLECKRLLDQAR